MMTTKISVLYIDDEEMLLDIGKLFLERTGDCSVDIAISASQGIEQMGKKKYDAIVSDYQMPGMDGIELLKKIRTTSTIPFILFTGKGREDVVIEAINSGADFYLQKGGDPRSQFVELKHKIEQAVSRRWTEEALKKSETRYRELVDLLPQTVFEIDQTYTITSINPIALKTFGYTREDLEKGVNVFEVFSEGDHQRMRENIEGILQGMPTGALEYTAKRKDGTTFPVITYSVPIMQENTPVGLRGILVDISERKADEQAMLQALSLLESTVESTADGLLVIDRAGKIVHYNQKFLRMWHIPTSILATRDDASAISHVLDQLTDPGDFFAKVMELYKNRHEFSFDVVKFKDGRIFERYSQPQILRGEIVGRVWSFRDVTDRKRAEEALKESEIRYRTIFENTGTAMVIIEEDTTVGFANNEFFRMTGYSQADIDSRKSWTEFVHRNDLNRMIEQHRLRREKNKAALRQYEFRLLTKYGEIRNILLTIDMFPGTKRSIASLIDITGRRSMEEDLKKSRLLMQSVFDAVPDLLIVVDRNFQIMYTNAKGHDLVRQTDPEKSKTCYGRFKLLDQPCEVCSARPVFETGKAYEQEMINPADGRIREVRAFPLKDPDGSVSSVIEYVRDITERKRIEDALRESEEKYRNLSETTHDIIVTTDLDGNITYANPAAKKLMGIRETTGIALKDYMNPDQVMRHREMLEARRKGVSDILRYEWYFSSPTDGSTVYLDISSSLLMDGGKPSGVLFNARDNTYRRGVEEALRESEEKYRILAEGASDGIAIIRDGMLEYVNPCLAQMAGYSVEELTGASFVRFVSPESVADLLDVVKRAFSGGPAPTIFRTRIRHHDGHLLEIEASGTAITWSGKKALLGFIRNITDHSRTETGKEKSGQ